MNFFDLPDVKVEEGGLGSYRRHLFKLLNEQHKQVELEKLKNAETQQLSISEIQQRRIAFRSRMQQFELDGQKAKESAGGAKNPAIESTTNKSGTPAESKGCTSKVAKYFEKIRAKLYAEYERSMHEKAKEYVEKLFESRFPEPGISRGQMRREQRKIRDELDAKGLEMKRICQEGRAKFERELQRHFDILLQQLAKQYAKEGPESLAAYVRCECDKKNCKYKRLEATAKILSVAYQKNAPKAIKQGSGVKKLYRSRKK